MANILLILLFISSPVFAAETIRIQPQRTAVDGSYLYYTDLLRKALNNTRQEYGEAELVSVNRLTQARAFQALNDNQIDVFWAGTNREREVFVQPIRIPLHAGLLGIRIPVIRRPALTPCRTSANCRRSAPVRATTGQTPISLRPMVLMCSGRPSLK